MRTCTRCNETKSLEEYNKAGYDKEHGRMSICRECHRKSNSNRMWVNGVYIPMDHPLHKAGRYNTLEDAWSHVEIDTRSSDGYVYIIENKAWEGWYKVGKAASAEDRLNGYQTSSPFRDYELLYSAQFANRHHAEADVHRLLRNVISEENCKGEWFKADYEVIKDMIEAVKINEPQLDLFKEAS